VWLGLGGLGAASGGCLSPGAPGVAAATALPGAPVASAPPSEPGGAIEPRAGESLDQMMARLLEEQDTDCDQEITKTDQGSRRFRFRLQDQTYTLSGNYVLSNLLLELSVARRDGSAPRIDRVMEDPIRRTSRLIQSEYWPALTHKLDEDGLPRLLSSPKLRGRARQTLYVPGDDPVALGYFRKVARRYDAAYAALDDARHSLPLPELIDASATPEKRRVLRAMLSSPDGRRALRGVVQRLAEAARALDYPGLSRQLALVLARVDQLVERAARPCVQSSTSRLGAVAERVLQELGSFSPRRLSVEALPPAPSFATWAATLGDRHGPLSLALKEDPESGLAGVPFVAPGGGVHAMHGQDSYFILLGLLANDRLDLARSIVDDMVYSVEHYKAALGANHTHHLTRPEPPFLSSMLRAVWDATAPAERRTSWLRRGLNALLYEYREVWNGSERRVSSLCRGEADARTCLSRYAGTGTGQPPEAEPAHFNWLWQQTGRSLEASYVTGRLAQRNLTAELDRAFRHDRCMRESGHDATYRWFWKARAGASEEHWINRCADMVSVDLNSLLYKYEVDIAHLLRQLLAAGGGERALPAIPEPSTWCARAQNRFELMKQALWSRRDGLFYDAFLSDAGPVHTGYVSATTLYPLWATALPCEVDGVPSRATLTQEEQSLLVTNALSQLEAPGGLLATARTSRARFPMQQEPEWEYPNGRAPHQMLAWRGLEAHGFSEDAQRLSFSWLYTLLTHIIDFNDTIPESYDVVARTHAIFSNDKRAGTERAPIERAGFGAMNASFQVGLGVLSPEERERLAQAVAGR
jgi:alpha,alpha-trehalase